MGGHESSVEVISAAARDSGVVMYRPGVRRSVVLAMFINSPGGRFIPFVATVVPHDR